MSLLPARLPLSSGTTYYVGTSGSDAYTSTQAQSPSTPWRTINKALTTVPLTGSIIRVLPGTYTTSVASGYVINFQRAGDTSNPVTLMADQGLGSVVLNTNYPTSNPLVGAWVNNASGLRLQELYFNMRGRGAIGFDGGYTGVHALQIENSDWIEVYRCKFIDSGGLSLAIKGNILNNPSTHIDLYSNWFKGAGLDPTGTYFPVKGTHFIYSGQAGGDSSQYGVEQCVFANNVLIGTVPGHHMELGPQARYHYVVHNTYVGNQAADSTAGMAVQPFSNAANAYNTNNVVCKNNIMYDCRRAVYGSGAQLMGHADKNVSGSMTEATDYQTTYGATTIWTLGTNLSDTDPLFANLSAEDYHLLSGSPAIGYADSDYSPSFDFEGNPRSTDLTCGAYAYQAETGTEGVYGVLMHRNII